MIGKDLSILQGWRFSIVHHPNLDIVGLNEQNYSIFL
jgi:hypothetical protein